MNVKQVCGQRSLSRMTGQDLVPLWIWEGGELGISSPNHQCTGACPVTMCCNDQSTISFRLSAPCITAYQAIYS